MSIASIQTADFQKARALIRGAGMPDADVETAEWAHFLGKWHDGQLVSTAGLERCGSALLLRSVVTDPKHLGHGYAGQLIERLHTNAKETGYSEIYLMTMDTQDYFEQRFGYKQIQRNDVHKDIQGSEQFRGLCPADALIMKVGLD